MRRGETKKYKRRKEKEEGEEEEEEGKEDHDDTNDNGKQLEHEHVLHRRRGDGASEFLKSARREGSRERRGEEKDTRRRRRRRNRYPDRGRRGKGKRRDGVDIDSDERMMKRVVDKYRRDVFY